MGKQFKITTKLKRRKAYLKRRKQRVKDLVKSAKKPAK